jgi:transcriptional regulator with PAS, ATPase and Fis domain
VDCGSLVPTLIESELFGYVRGAFTGAVRAKDGLLAAAEGGTVFLDEVGELPVDLQAKLLRAIQEKEVRPVGGTRAIPINVRILAATNRDLDAAVQQGTFRRDLYFRLNVLTLRIPPLRERKQDIPLLIGNALERINGATEMQHSVGDDALRAMLNYDWPGNVRELENVIERAVVLANGPKLTVDLLPDNMVGRGSKLALMEHRPDASLFEIMEDCERSIISDMLEKSGWNQTEAADRFRIPLSTLNQKIKRLNIEIKKKGRE